MADQKLGQPVRTETDADERVQVKIVDSTNPATQQGVVDTDGNFHIKAHGNNPAAGDETLRLSELGAPNTDGDYDATNNTQPASVGLIVHDRNATPGVTHQNVRPTGIQSTDDTTIYAMDVAIKDSDGDPISSANPLPVTFEEGAGVEVHDYQTSSSVATDASTNHDYSVADGVTVQLIRFSVSASARFKAELQIGDGAVSETFTTLEVQFGTVSNPTVNFEYSRAPRAVLGTVNTTTIRMVITNTDNQAQDVYSTLKGKQQ